MTDRSADFLAGADLDDGLSPGVRVRLMLDAIEIVTSPDWLSPRSTSSKLHAANVRVGADGTAEIVGEGDETGLVELLWEILAARPMPTPRVPLREAAWGVPEELVGRVDAALDDRSTLDDGWLEHMTEASEHASDTSEDVEHAFSSLMLDRAAEKERIEREKAEAERIEREKAEAERIEKEKAEAERVEKEKAEAERIEKEKAEAERIEKEKAEAPPQPPARPDPPAPAASPARAQPRSSAEGTPLPKPKGPAEGTPLPKPKGAAERTALPRPTGLAGSTPLPRPGPPAAATPPPKPERAAPTTADPIVPPADPTPSPSVNGAPSANGAARQASESTPVVHGRPPMPTEPLGEGPPPNPAPPVRAARKSKRPPPAADLKSESTTEPLERLHVDALPTSKTMPPARPRTPPAPGRVVTPATPSKGPAAVEATDDDDALPPIPSRSIGRFIGAGMLVGLVTVGIIWAMSPDKPPPTPRLPTATAAPTLIPPPFPPALPPPQIAAPPSATPSAAPSATAAPPPPKKPPPPPPFNPSKKPPKAPKPPPKKDPFTPKEL